MAPGTNMSLKILDASRGASVSEGAWSRQGDTPSTGRKNRAHTFRGSQQQVGAKLGKLCSSLHLAAPCSVVERRGPCKQQAGTARHQASRHVRMRVAHGLVEPGDRVPRTKAWPDGTRARE